MQVNFSRAAATFDAAAVLARETGRRLGERLTYTKIQPARFADIGCATGDGVRDLQQRFPKAQPLAIDSARPMLHAVRQRVPLLSRLKRSAPQLIQADVRQLPLAANSLGLVWSNLMLHWLDDPFPAIQEMYRVLEVGGLITFAVLGPDTVKEWHTAAAKVGADSTARRFLDMHDWGDMLVKAGFGDPVMDRDDIVLTYQQPPQLLADQRHLGVRDAMFGNPGWRSARALLRAWERDNDGLLPLSFEIVYGQAWKPAPRPARQTAEGHTVIAFHR